MAKARSKRQIVRDERRKKKRDREAANDDARETKRQRREEEEQDHKQELNEEGLHPDRQGALFFHDVGGQGAEMPVSFEAYPHAGYERDNDPKNSVPPREFFGLLTEEEQESFRQMDEELEQLNSVGSSEEERQSMIESAFDSLQGREMKLMSSQSCSRLMERLIQAATSRQLKGLFRAITGHVATLVTHRFASHCCEQLFLQAAGVLDEEEEEAEETETNEASAEETKEDKNTMEELFLFVLDELEPHISSLLTDRFGSHTLRVLLVVLSGRPLDEMTTGTLVRSRKKEGIAGFGEGEDRPKREMASTGRDKEKTVRVVPESFQLAVRKIVSDVATSLDATGLRVLATHPTGNPALQLLVELEMGEKKRGRGKDKKEKTKDKEEGKKEKDEEKETTSLLDKLLPDAPSSLSDSSSQASTFLRSLAYDRIGSRLLETLVVHSSSKLFKPLYANMFASKKDDNDNNETPLAVYLRNDVACFPAMRVLERLSRDDLTAVMRDQILKKTTGDTTKQRKNLVAQLVERARFAVLRTLVERCRVREVDGVLVQALVQEIVAAAGGEDRLVLRLCLLEEEEESKDQANSSNKDQKMIAAQEGPAPTPAQRYAAAAQGAEMICQLLQQSATVTTAQDAILALDDGDLVRVATTSPPTARILTTALHAKEPKEPKEPKESQSQGQNNQNQNQSQKNRNQNRKNQPRKIVVPFPKRLVARLVPHTKTLAMSSAGQAVLVAIVETPSRVGGVGEERGEGEEERVEDEEKIKTTLQLPFHLKDAIMAQLAANEHALRDCRPGKIVWRAWHGDTWRKRRAEWIRWAKEAEPQGQRAALAPVVRGKEFGGKEAREGREGQGFRGKERDRKRQ